MTRFRTVLLCGSLVVLSSLSLSVFFVTLLGREEAPVNPGFSKRYLQDSTHESRNRNILDVHYSNAVQEEPASDETEEEVRSSPTTPEKDHSLPTEDRILITGDCKGPWPGYPECENRMEWMRINWEIDTCYADFGVDGSNCSFQIYLSEVEYWCPGLPEREAIAKSKKKHEAAVIQHDITPLLNRLSSNVKFEWISNRIKRLWPNWSRALSTLEAQQPFVHSTSNILVHIGALSDKAGFKFAENAGRGGPLGELVQWSDLIASLFALGYSIDFSTEIGQLRDFLVVNTKGGCPSVSETKYSAIFIDIVGLKQFKKIARNRFNVYKCLVRVLDSFGTEPVFNYKKWKPQKDTSKNDYGRTWGNWELNPRQFMTMYPHTPDNSFLGFVVEANQNFTPSSAPSRRNSSLVYGKELYMWEGTSTPSYLKIISKYFDIHATIGTTTRKGDMLDWSVIPPFVQNYGILDGVHLTQALRESRLFIGLGFPYEGPAPLEAIAQGCVFLNPKVDPPVNRFNSKFFQKKPTLREIDSQNPYMAMFVGKPYVYTLDSTNMEEVEQTLQEILREPRPPPYIPYEFTFEGMLERITAYLSNQKFCEPNQWPPVEVLEARISKPDQSCKDACYEEGLVCEPELFSKLNTRSAFESNGLQCGDVKVEHSIHGPSIDIQTHTCSLQLDHLLLSCAGHQKDIQRLCPCRKYRKGQVALCVTCSR